jgi:hypothetical protein
MVILADTIDHELGMGGVNGNLGKQGTEGQGKKIED